MSAPPAAFPGPAPADRDAAPRLGSLAPDVLRMAVDSVRAHSMRSLLTTLGVVIGVATVVAMASVIQGFDHAVESSISSFGSHLIYIRTFKPAVYVGGFPDSLRHREAFTPEDAQAIRDQCPDVRQVSVVGFVEESTVSRLDHTSRGLELLGSDPELEEVEHFDLQDGRFFTPDEAHRRSQVIIIGPDVRSGLFPKGGDAIGQTIHVDGQPFRVIGVLTPKGRSLFGNPDELLVIPFPTLEKLFPPPPDAPFYVPKRGLCYMNATPVSPERMTAALDEIRGVLRVRRRVPADKQDNFAVLTEDSLTDVYNQLTGATFVVMLLISSVALVVGGIGVMNIMLVAVTERTREIGVRRAVGAPRATILLQFLLEAAMLTGVGGILGILLGTGLAQAVRALSSLPAYTPLWSVIVAFAFSVAVGVFFGFYPAMRAARLDPVDALRYE